MISLENGERNKLRGFGRLVSREKVSHKPSWNSIEPCNHLCRGVLENMKLQSFYYTKPYHKMQGQEIALDLLNTGLPELMVHIDLGAMQMHQCLLIEH